MHIDLSNKNILVTGASRGIGRAIARSLAASGATVGIHYNHSEDAAHRLASELNGQSRLFQANLAEPTACEQLFDEARAAFGQIHVLVNNAGLARHAPLDDPLDVWLDAWDQTLNVNLRATGLLCRAAVRHFREVGGGRIINITSRAAFRGDTPDYMAYAASKGGMVSLTRTIARAFGKDNITAFDIAPGFTRTDMAQDFIDEYGESIAVDDLALNRMTEPENIAPFVVLLASGLADHATGTTIDINAGSYVH